MSSTSRVLALSLVGALLAGTAQAQTIRLSTYVNETDIRYQGFVRFAELVAEKSEGRLNVQIFPSSTLHGWSDGVDAIQGGVADISWISADTRLPCYRVTSLYPAAVDLTAGCRLRRADRARGCQGGVDSRNQLELLV